MASLQLRHTSSTDREDLLSGDVTEWTVLKDNIGSTETQVFVSDQEFNTGLYNIFAMVAFEDEKLRDSGHFTGVATDVIIEPKVERGIYVRSLMDSISVALLGKNHRDLYNNSCCCR